jgi:hypothetical protein
MVTDRPNNRLLEIIIPVLILADGVLHLVLDFVLFHGVLIGSPFPAGGARPAGAGPRAGAPPPPRLPLPLPLNEMFVLNFIGAVVLVVLFVVGRRWSRAARALLDVVIIGYEALTFIAWWLFGRPNPHGLGYLSKGIEIVLVVALIVHLVSMLRTRSAAGAAVAAGG